MYHCNILTSDPAKLSDEKCTCVNNRCIRSKISGDNLDCRRVEMRANCDATGSRWMSNNYITRVRQDVSLLEIGEWSQYSSSRSENQTHQRLGPQVPGWAAQENAKEILLWPEEWGSICCSLCSVSHSPLTR